MDGVEHVSGYVSQPGRIVTTQRQAVTVRPYGNNATYPQHAGDPNSVGFDITIDLGGNKGMLVLQTGGIIVDDAPGVFGRWHASVSGHMTKTGQQWNDGVGFLDQFRLAPP